MTDYRLTIEGSVTNDATNNDCADLVCNYNKLMIYKSNGCLLAAHCSDNMHESIKTINQSEKLQLCSMYSMIYLKVCFYVTEYLVIST